MANTYDTTGSTGSSKSSAELEREVEEQRSRVEARIGEIKDRLSPGQLVDELLSYTKTSGSHFASNLGHQIAANPLPAALVGVGLAWLMSSNISGGNSHSGSTPARSPGSSNPTSAPDYPYATVKGTGGLRRVKHAADEAGQWWSEFETDAGDRYKALSNEVGNRAGYFTDQSGKMFSGFIDDAGHRVGRFRDEAGNMMDDAKGWASHGWHELTHTLSQGLSNLTGQARQMGSQAISGARGMTSNLTSGTRQLGSNLSSGTRSLGGSVQHTVQGQSQVMSRQVANLFEQQPLIAGALAFAAGAAIAAALPHTRQEDEMLGEQADQIRQQAGAKAGELYEQGKGQVAHLYEDASGRAAELYGTVKDQVADIGSTVTDKVQNLASSAQGGASSGDDGQQGGNEQSPNPAPSAA